MKTSCLGGTIAGILMREDFEFPVKILVIEDEPRVAELLARGLTQAQHVVDIAETGANGLMMAADGH